MNSIALGRYVPYDTFIHRLDPRAKLLALIMLLITVFLPSSILGYLLLIIVVIALLRIAKIRLKTVYRSLKPMWFMMLFLFIFNILLIKSGDVWFEFAGIAFHKTAFVQTISIFIRLTLMVSITTILTTTTKPLDLTYGLEALMSPLKLLKFPSHEIAMTISIALRFIPTLLEETEKIIKAQASRGVELSQGKFSEKITAVISLIIPLFISSFQRSEDLANAMEARGYHPGGTRTRYRKLEWKARDNVALIVTAILLTATILLNTYSYLIGVISL